MSIAPQQLCFAWDAMEDSPTLKTIEQFLQIIPDAELIESLERWRGRGRNDCPVRVALRCLWLTVALRHTSFQATLGELRRNGDLRHLIGIQKEEDVPSAANISRFLKVLGRLPHRALLQGVFDRMIQRLGVAVADLGAQTAGDSTGLSARPLRTRDVGELESEADLPAPTGGRKEYTDESGKVVKVVQWFGYKLHLLVDRRHEVALAYRITSTKVGDNVALPKLVQQAQANLPEGRIQTLAYDKAADDEKVHEFLNNQNIMPVIQNRALWKEESERLLPGHDGNSNIVYDEAGTVYCYNKVSDPPVRQKMSYIGHERSRATIKYRCPARHGGWKCPSDRRCNAGLKYGKTIRIKCELDLRRFPPIPRATKKFERLYKGRTAVERVNARCKIFWGADDGNVTGACRFFAHVGGVMVVHAGLATLQARVKQRMGTLGKMRLTPLVKALAKQGALA
jgi:hypothetical protein